jgi:oxepin-CoA hydrolase/3-oxo-5,6-dehydrosuberyl-CoA semialdehyde dehydrogenase
MKVDITNRQELNSHLNNLTENTQPKWGSLKPQNMIEHLAKTLQFTNGKKEIAQRTTEEEGLKAKQAFIYSDVEMSMGLKSPLLPTEGPIPFEFSSLDEAKKNLNKELDDFEIYHAKHPDALFVQPRLGKLNYKEWVIFHNKHFTHHFKQFGLIE